MLSIPVSLRGWVALSVATLLLSSGGCGVREVGDPNLQFASFSDHVRTDSPFTVAAQSLSPAPITYMILSGPATMTANAITLSGGTGTVLIQAQQVNTANYRSATAQAMFDVSPAVPRLTFQGSWSGPATISLTSTSQSDAPVGYEVSSGPGSISGTTLTITGAGQVIVNATQAANAGYKAAAATDTFAIAAAKLTFSPATVQFPSTKSGSSSAPETVLVKNEGDLDSKLIGFTAPSNFAIKSSCGTVIAAHATCQLGLIFSPTSAGNIAGQATADSDTGAYALFLSGTSIQANPPVLSGASVSRLSSGTSTTFHLFGQNLDTVTNVVAGGVTYPIKVVSGSDVFLTVTPAAWAVGGVSITAQANGTLSNTISLPLVPQPVSYDTAVRFAQQVAMAVTPDLIAQIQQRGLAGWIDWQMSTDMYPYETLSGMTYGVYMTNTQKTQYALRQRTTLALKEIYTFGASDQCFATQCGHYWEARLQKDAFGNERTLLTDITLSPLMGNFLNNARNFMNYPFVGTHRANQNYARELMQLMTIGPNKLNHDGSTSTDANGNPILNYSEDNISDMAAAMSGYYMTGLGQYAKVTDGDPLTPMSLWEVAHSPLAKDPLPGLHLPAAQGGTADTTAVLDALFNHPNMGPFLARRFIQHFVTSNPSPEYIARIADVFDDDGTGKRGNLAAVVKAVLLDPEARRGDDPSTAVDTDSHMMEPLLYISNVMSAVGGIYSDDRVYLVIDVMGQDLFMSPTVFGPYSPDNRIATGEYAPEMQLVNNAGYLERITFVHSMVTTGLPGMPCSLTLSPFYNAADSSALLEQMRHFLFHGRVPAPLESALETYVAANPNVAPNALLPGLLQIALTSSSYQVLR